MLKKRYIRLKEPSIFLAIAGSITASALMAIPALFRYMGIFSKADLVVQLDLYIKIIWQNRSTSQKKCYFKWFDYNDVLYIKITPSVICSAVNI